MADPGFDDIADELYGVPPADFVAARTQARDRARAAGHKALAADVAALPKPSTAAWVCNLLVRRRHEEIAQLVELGGMMREAQRALSGEQLRELGRQRASVVAALARQARGLAADAGHPVSSAVAEQIEGTLRAAVADAAAGRALLDGRLTAALSYTGLGPVDVGGAVAPAPEDRSPAGQPAGDDAGKSARHDLAAAERRRREAEEARRRQIARAEQDAREGEAVARDTAAAAEVAGQRLAAARVREDDLGTRLAELEEDLRRTRQRARTAATEMAEAEQRSAAAARRAQTAAAIRDRAQERAAQLRADR